METASIMLYWVALACFAAASVQFFYHIVLNHKQSVPPQLLAGLGGLALTASIGMHSTINHGTPLTGANQLVLGAWALVIIYFFVEYVLKFTLYGGALVPVAAVLLAAAQLVGRGTSSIAPAEGTILAEQMRGGGIAFHVALIVFANGLFLICAIASALYVYQDSALKKHSTSAFSRKLPSLAKLEKLAARTATYGLPIYIAGQLLGVLRAIQEDVGGWWLDPRIMTSGAVAFTFIGFVVMYYRQRTSGVVTSRIAMLGGVLVVILMILARTLPVGFHLFGILR